MIIHGPHRMCRGETIILSAAEGYATYNWLPDGQTTREISVSPLVTTTYQVVASNPGEPSITSVAHPVAVYDPPEPSVEYLSEIVGGSEIWTLAEGNITSEDSSVVLRATGDYSSYQWYRGGVPIHGATFKYYQAIVDGNYQVQVRSFVGCYGYSQTQSVEVSDEPSCFVRLMRPVQGDRGVPVNTELVFDVRFNYIIPGDPPFPSVDTINVIITDGDRPVMSFIGRPDNNNIVIYEPDDPLGIESGYRYYITGIRFRGGSTIKIDVIVS